MVTLLGCAFNLRVVAILNERGQEHPWECDGRCDALSLLGDTTLKGVTRIAPNKQSIKEVSSSKYSSSRETRAGRAFVSYKLWHMRVKNAYKL